MSDAMQNVCTTSPAYRFYKSLYGEMVKISSFVSKDMKIAVSYKMQFGFQFLQILFNITLIYFIGKMVQGNGSGGNFASYGGGYFSFALVGLAVNSYLRAGLVTITNDIRQMMNQGVLEAMCATPIRYNRLLLYLSLWQFCFETAKVFIYFLAGLMIAGADFSGTNWTGVILTMALTIPIFLLLGVMSCSILILTKRGDPINWIFSSLGSLLAGTMFPITVLPNWLRAVSNVMPLTHSLEAMRQSMLAGASVKQIFPDLAALSIFLAVLIPATAAVNYLCMKRAKINGSFSTH